MKRRASLAARRLTLVTVAIAATLTALVASTGTAVPTPAASLAQPTPDVVTVPPPRPETMMVIGDSYTSYYGDRDSQFPGWWATLGVDLGLEPVLFAEAGTGYLASGGTCEHTNYAARIDAVRELDPRILFIEGGRNDPRLCTRSGQLATSTRTQIAAAIDQFFTELAKTWDDLGRQRADVYVLAPWGQSRGDKAAVIRPLIRETAKRYGFTWVPTRRLTLQYAPDGTHPNRQGSLFLRDEVLANTDLLARFGTVRS